MKSIFKGVKTMAKEYIESKALMHDIMRTVIVSEKKKGYTNPELKGISKVIDRIKAQSTADVQEVRHGKNCFKPKTILPNYLEKSDS